MEKQPQLSVQGTTLEVLQAYPMGADGIDVEVIEPYGFAGERYRLWGIDMRREFPVLCNNDEQQTEYAFFGLLPVLRPFSALAEPLADGTVPALRAFKKVLANEPEPLDWSRARAELSQPAPYSRPEAWLLMLFVPIQNEVGGFMLRMSQDWIVSGGSPDYERLYLKALLAEHAAVALEPHQYIAKAAGSPAIQEGAPAGE